MNTKEELKARFCRAYNEWIAMNRLVGSLHNEDFSWHNLRILWDAYCEARDEWFAHKSVYSSTFN